MIASSALVERLNKLEDRPWADKRRGSGVSAAWVAKQLAEFDIPPPARIRFSASGQQLRGYFRHWFADAWDRYLAAAADFEVSQCHSGNNDGPESSDSKCHTAESVTPAKTAISSITAGVVTHVTLATPKQALLVADAPSRGRRAPADVEDGERFTTC